MMPHSLAPSIGLVTTDPTATRPLPSPALTLQQPLDDAVDIELVYIRHRLSAAGRTSPRGCPPSARLLAGPTSLLVLSRFAPSSSPPRFSPSSPPAPPSSAARQTRSTEQNGRHHLSELARRTDTRSAMRLTGNPLEAGGKNGAGQCAAATPRSRYPSAHEWGSSAAVPLACLAAAGGARSVQIQP